MKDAEDPNDSEEESELDDDEYKEQDPVATEMNNKYGHRSGRYDLRPRQAPSF
jgi:hypothetical protein